MRFGPFTKSTARSLADRLHAANIPFEVEDNREDIAQAEVQWKAATLVNPMLEGGPRLDPAFVYFTIPEEIVREPNAVLEELGLVSTPFEPNFSVREFVCQECGFVVAHEPGFCPRHTRPLISWEEHIASKRAREDQWGTRIAWTGLAMIAALCLYILVNYLGRR